MEVVLGTDKFQTLWFSGLLLAMSVLAIVKGGRIAWKRELDNPIVPLQGGRALALGVAAVALGLVGLVMAISEGLKLRF